MTERDTAGVTEQLAAGDRSGVDAGTYELLRARLVDRAGELARRAEELNARRSDVFGGAEWRLLGTARIDTGRECVPRDLVPLGDLLLLGHESPTGQEMETTVEDVFSLHRIERATADGERIPGFAPVADAELPGLTGDPEFRRDFGELHRYYRGTRLLRLRRLAGRLLAVFRTGPHVGDIRVLRWRVAPDGSLGYLDSRGERDHVFPPAYDFEWIVTTRDDHVPGRYPHISIEDEVFVSTIGGTLTVKVDDDTETTAGIHTEPVDEPLQSLADAEVHRARVGPLILLRVRPYKEEEWRHLVFNTLTREVVRLDGIGNACRRLPEEHGIIFPGGYYLTTGVCRTFDIDVRGLEFERTVRAPNGEDVLYVFHTRHDGRRLLLPYNVIRREVDTPIDCHGYALFDDGTLAVSRRLPAGPTRVHPMQIWRTPYLSDAYAAAQPVGTGPLERIGNPDLVRGIADCLTVARLARESTASAGVFEALLAACVRVADAHHWLDDALLGDLAAPLAEVRATAQQVLDEYGKARALTAHATAAVDEAAEGVAALVRRLRGEAPRGADGWVELLAELRRARGRLEGLRELRYVDQDRIDALVATVETELTAAAGRAVGFLDRDDAFAEQHAGIDRLIVAAGKIGGTAEAAPIADRLTGQAEGLRLVTEVVGGLEIADPAVRTRILERIAEVLGGINRARAILDARRRALLSAEQRAGFAAEFALLNQAVAGAVAVADTPEGCDEQLGRLLLQVEGLEARFAEFDDFLAELTDKRAEIYEVFSSRRQALLDERARRADRLVASAGRILSGVERRVAWLDSPDEINTYFTTDPMVGKLHAIVADLRDLGDPVRAEELLGRIRTARQAAGRALRDRIDLYAGDGRTIRLGRHRFAVNTQPLDVTLVPHGDGLAFAVTGTDYHAPVRDEAFAATRPFWDQPLVSESAEVSRAEYLATSILAAAEAGRAGPGMADLLAAVEGDGAGLRDLTRRVAETRYDEGYERGIHDHDAAVILAALLPAYTVAGLLRYPPTARAAAGFCWAYGVDAVTRAAWTRRAISLARARALFGHTPAIDELRTELAGAVTDFLTRAGLTGLATSADLAGEYLFEELAHTPAGFVTDAGARLLVDRFQRTLDGSGPAAVKEFEEDLRALGEDLAARYQLVTAWLGAYLAAAAVDDPTAADAEPDLPEAAAILVCGAELPRRDAPATPVVTATGLLAAHPRVVAGRSAVRLDELLTRTRRFRLERVPAYRAYQRRRNELVATERDRLRLADYTPRVLGAFVRNRLLDEVYLPLIGDNLARQLGAVGDGERVDRSGLLMLISPPGYGKTTLMEYVANRLGLVFVKVDGPALGSAVTSLDPAEAPNATARREVEKINLALEMGSNVLLYLDDIQHTSPELLQKFIPLCDAQRRIEGVWQGQARSYDLRGKRFAVCMSGNPYTESGQRFRVPDMLANRADVWNLGDVLTGREEIFALSYLENALTANPVLAPLAGRDRADLELLLRMAAGDTSARPDQLGYPYPEAEREQIVAVLARLLTVREVVLATNRAYIDSAARADASRTEPPFQLQGSYRNMNKLAERIVPVMNETELAALIDDHYTGEAQTLAGAAEANLLKFAELRGRLTPEQARRWAEVKQGYLRARALGGSTDDAVGRAVGAIGLLADRVGEIRTAIDRKAG